MWGCIATVEPCNKTRNYRHQPKAVPTFCITNQRWNILANVRLASRFDDHASKQQNFSVGYQKVPFKLKTSQVTKFANITSLLLSRLLSPTVCQFWKERSGGRGARNGASSLDCFCHRGDLIYTRVAIDLTAGCKPRWWKSHRPTRWLGSLPTHCYRVNQLKLWSKTNMLDQAAT